jgi:hypothetical protein
MGKKLNKLFFDKRDRELIRIVNDALSADGSARFARKVYFPYLHPHGIKEMTETKGLRTASMRCARCAMKSSTQLKGLCLKIRPGCCCRS